jgi:exosome complex component RRP43
LSSSLNDVLNSPQVFDPSQLDIREGEVFWTLHVHVVCLNYDGNAFDLCLLAALAALEDTVLPSLGEGVGKADEPGRLVETASGATEKVFEGRALELLSRPLPVTFAQLPGKHWVVDPSAQEEDLGVSVSLCLVGSRWLVQHQGAANVENFLGELMPLARSSVSDITALLDSGSQPAAHGDYMDTR